MITIPSSGDFPTGVGPGNRCLSSLCPCLSPTLPPLHPSSHIISSRMYAELTKLNTIRPQTEFSPSPSHPLPTAPPECFNFILLWCPWESVFGGNADRMQHEQMAMMWAGKGRGSALKYRAESTHILQGAQHLRGSLGVHGRCCLCPGLRAQSQWKSAQTYLWGHVERLHLDLCWVGFVWSLLGFAIVSFVTLVFTHAFGRFAIFVLRGQLELLKRLGEFRLLCPSREDLHSNLHQDPAPVWHAFSEAFIQFLVVIHQAVVPGWAIQVNPGRSKRGQEA